MKNVSWKTTVAGFLLIGVGIFMYISTKEAINSLAFVMAGIGLIAAKDSDKTGLPNAG